ncbi:MAG: phosphate ABC transporter substrate-binding protein PstS [Gemmatimonadaceae bacterium]
MKIQDMATTLAVGAALLGCAGGDAKQRADSGSVPAASTGGAVDLTGAGATFPYPIYRKWFADYAASTGVRINYQSIGSGGGIRQLSEGTVDFGASDAPMKDDEMAKAQGGPILHVPTVIGAVVLAYNLPGLAQPLKLDGATVADVFLGKISRWNDARIAALNPGVSLPAEDILVVHRTDGSGTTYVFTDYLSAVSAAWKSGPGTGKEVKWPVGLGGKGNEGVSGTVKQTPGAFGYTELAYAKQNGLATASLKNAAGQFVAPSVASATSAAEGAVAGLGAGTDYRVSIVNAPGAASYPISSFTYLLVYQNQTDAAKGKKLVDFLRWALGEGQQRAAALDYAPLPKSVADALLARLGEVKVAAAPAGR